MIKYIFVVLSGLFMYYLLINFGEDIKRSTLLVSCFCLAYLIENSTD
jgi:hypothetical protein